MGCCVEEAHAEEVGEDLLAALAEVDGEGKGC